ncbi:MAG: GAF domain-containing protein, partial [Bacteroidota bacterium]
DIFGPESIKYETLKKRIEKATVVDSDERLTQKNKIAIVYMNGETRLEYLEYIKSLQFENVLSNQIEDLELAPLQDITGLRALRITLA